MRCLRAIQFLLLFLFLFPFLSTISSQKTNKCNYSYLQDVSLNKRVSSPDDYQKMMESQLPGRSFEEGGLPDFHTDVVTGRKITFNYARHAIQSVQIDCDAPDYIKGTIYTEGISKGYITIEVTNARYQGITAIPAARLTISGTNTLPFEIKMNENSSTSSMMNSVYLKVSYFESENVSKGKIYWFDMPKNWKGSFKDKAIKNSLSLINRKEFKAENLTTESGKQNKKVKIPVHIDLSAGIPLELSGFFKTDLTRIFFDTTKREFNIIPKSLYLKQGSDGRSPKYGMNINYGGLNNGVGKVAYTIHLFSDIQESEINVLKQLLRRRFNLKSVNIKPLQFKEEPTVNLSISGQLGIKQSEISIGKFRKFSEPLIVSFNCDLVTSDDLLSQLSSGLKITGDLSFASYGIQSIPIEIDLANNMSFGMMYHEFKDLINLHSTYANSFPLPVSLKKLLLWNTDSMKICIYEVTKNLIKPDELFQVNQAENLISGSENVSNFDLCWFEYDLIPEKVYFDEMITEISSGVSEELRKFIRFENFYSEAFEKYKIKALKLKVKSIQLDPRNAQLKSLSYDLNPSEDIVEIGPFFVTDETNLSYQYQFELVTLDDVFISNWIPAKTLELYLQRSNFDMAFNNTKLQIK